MFDNSTTAGSVSAPRLPAAVLAHLPTPGLVVDLAACDRNIGRAAEYFRGRHAKLRPHYKAHKCSTLLRRQVDAGSCVGVTCATAAEAAVLAREGFADVLVANQVADPPGLDQLVAAARQTSVTVAVDDPWHVDVLEARAARAGVRLGVLIEIDVGMDRCGLAPRSPGLLALAEMVVSSANLELHGLQGYEGHAVLRPTREERTEHVKRAAEILGAEREALVRSSLPCPVVSGGGTGTFDLVDEFGVLDEVQAGSYALMDARYATLDLPFENALFCATTVVSHRRPDAAALNAGLKALTVEYGMPASTMAGVEVLKLADEHAWVSVAEAAPIAVGDTVFLIPAHIDPAVNLHDVLHVWDADDERMQAWEVDGRRGHDPAEAS